jgi:aldehyde dehydrogenase (NAD+)
MSLAADPSIEHSFPAIAAQIERVRLGFAAGRVHRVDDRATQLRQLRRFLVDEQAALAIALLADLGKSPVEAYTTEIGFVIGEVDHVLDRLESWTRPRRVGMPLHLRPGTARIVPEPLGTVLIIAPWNYPLHLLLAPLVPALAAGNTAILKPSEIAPATAAVVAERLPHYLDGGAVQVVTGGVPETTALLGERFDHIFYTGNGSVGKIVMRAAAEHLTPVTLELGGKSPVIVTQSADIRVSARRIAWGKCVNAGQTCVAPDYVLVPTAMADRFVDAVSDAIQGFYGPDPATSNDYGRIVSVRHFDRLVGLLDAGGFERIAHGGRHDRDTRFFEPTVLRDVDPGAAVMTDEIFGPILPIVTYDDLDEAIAFVADRPKPLALYVFDRRGDAADRIIDRTSSGGVTVNHTLLHLAVPDFPFGGVGASGIGSYHGQFGFDRFSHLKPVLRRTTRPDPKLAYPPYTEFKERVLRTLL